MDDKYIFTINNYNKYLEQAKQNDNVSQLIISVYYYGSIFPENKE